MGPSIFNEEMLSIGGHQAVADLSIFAFGNRVLPGEYMLDVMLNGRDLGQHRIRFEAGDAQQDAQPCITAAMLTQWEVNTGAFAAFAAFAAKADAGEHCVVLKDVIADAHVSHDASRQRLLISVPQAAMQRSARGALTPDRWDSGINGVMFDYQLSASHRSGSAAQAYSNSDVSGAWGQPPATRQRKYTLFGGLRVAANIGDWRLRNFSTYQRGVDGRTRHRNIGKSLQRDLPSWRGQLHIGDGHTPANLFDSVPFRGIQFSSDEAMLPDSLRGYAPTLRGVAQTNARVSVRQNGHVIYSSFVAPGAFIIDDLYPTSNGGDLEMIVDEADGRQTRTVHPYTAVPTLVREGATRYAATLGRYRDPREAASLGTDGARLRPWFVQATATRGLGGEFTAYGGVMAASMYQSVLLGAGHNLKRLGAVSVDLTAARSTDAQGKRHDGQSLRFLYAKSFAFSGTDLRLAGLRHSTRSFRTFSEAVRMHGERGLGSASGRRHEMRLEVSQRIGDLGSVFASARVQRYWGGSGLDRQFQLGYSGFWKGLGYSLYLSDNRGASVGSSGRQIMFTLNIPLGRAHANGHYSVTSRRDGSVAHQASLYGTLLDDRRLSYNLSAARASEGARTFSASGSYQSRVGRFDAGHSRGRGFGQTSLSMAGGAVWHADGLTLSQPLGETVALVQVPEADGVGIESRTGIFTDARGHAVVPHLSPYRVNRIALRTQDLGDTIDVANAVADVVPNRGALVRARFETAVGFRLLMSLQHPDGAPLPLGARIEDADGREVGLVGPDGQAYVSGAAPAARLRVVWGRAPDSRCHFEYVLPELADPPPVREWAGVCRPGGPVWLTTEGQS